MIKQYNCYRNQEWYFFFIFQIDLIDIMKKYEKKYKRPLAETIENNCRGRFKNVLLALLNQKAKTW